MEAYHKYGTIKRTVLAREPWYPVDRQALPPWFWCDCCGREVYRKDACRCTRCRERIETGLQTGS